MKTVWFGRAAGVKPGNGEVKPDGHQSLNSAIRDLGSSCGVVSGVFREV